MTLRHRLAAGTKTYHQTFGHQTFGQRRGDLTSWLGPLPPSGRIGRIRGIDAARGVAIIGMMVVHIFPLFNESDGSRSIAWAVFAGRSAALFAVLAGVSIALMTGGPRGLGTAPGQRLAASASLAVRAGMLVLIGLALGHFSENADVILVFYGVMFLLAIPLLTLPVRRLALLTACIAVFAPVLMQGLRDHLPPPPDSDPTFSSLEHPFRFASTLLLTGVYPALPWMAYICCGLAIGRLMRPTKRFAVALLASGTVVAVLAWVASGLLLRQLGGLEHIRDASTLGRGEIRDILLWGPDPTLPTSTWWWLAIRAPHSSTPFDILHTLGSAVAVLGAMLLLSHFAHSALRPLTMMGSMTLTLYTVHVLAVSTGLGLNHPYLAFLLHVTAAATFAFWWRDRFGQGPVERAVSRPAKQVRDAVLATVSARTPQPDREPVT